MLNFDHINKMVGHHLVTNLNPYIIRNANVLITTLEYDINDTIETINLSNYITLTGNDLICPTVKTEKFFLRLAHEINKVISNKDKYKFNSSTLKAERILKEMVYRYIYEDGTTMLLNDKPLSRPTLTLDSNCNLDTLYLVSVSGRIRKLSHKESGLMNGKLSSLYVKGIARENGYNLDKETKKILTKYCKHISLDETLLEKHPFKRKNNFKDIK